MDGVVVSSRSRISTRQTRWSRQPAVSLDRRSLDRPTRQVLAARRLPTGATGLLAAYLYRLGEDWRPALAAASTTDRLLTALAIAGDQPG